MVNRDVGLAQGFVARLPAWAQTEGREKLCREWVKKDPAATAAYTLSLGGGEEGGASELTLGCVKNWADSELEGARDWVARMPPGKARGQAMTKVCDQWTESDAKGCATYLLAHQSEADESLAKNSSFQNAAGVWAEESPDEMVRWSQTLSDVAARDAALKDGARRLAKDDLSKAAQMIAAISPAGRAAAVKEVVGNLEGHFPEAAALVESLPNDQTAVKATTKFAGQWGEKDSAAAAAWLAARPAGPARDAAAKEVVWDVVEHQDIAAAAQTLALVQDPKQKADALESMATAYLDKGRAAAKAWVASSPLFTPKARAKWLQEVEKDEKEEADGDDNDDD